MEIIIALLSLSAIVFGVMVISQKGVGNFLAGGVAILAALHAYNEMVFWPLLVGYAVLWVFRAIGLEKTTIPMTSEEPSLQSSLSVTKNHSNSAQSAHSDASDTNTQNELGMRGIDKRPTSSELRANAFPQRFKKASNDQKAQTPDK